jgi:aspartate kinase
MVVCVRKFGGSSLADAERIVRAARRVASEHAAGRPGAVVVSAMAGVTDGLLRLARQLGNGRHLRETDVLLASGEQQSAALFAMALRDLGHEAEVFHGHRVGIYTNELHTRAQIRWVGAGPVLDALARGAIPVICGFQGLARDGHQATLGRGGSDTTAVAYAAAMGCGCEIYTDVEGVFTADPRIVPEARLLPQITYDEIIELASCGAKVMETRSVVLAKQ